MGRLEGQLEDILAVGGLLAKVVPRYDARPQQLELGRAVLDALLTERVLLAEAPTGVGKTLAYLVPAALYARREHEPVVVSTYTRALQDQILQQEAPRLRRLVHPDLSVVVLKGRANYLCRRRWDLFVAEEGSGTDGRRAVELLEPWVFATETGDFAEAPDLGPRAGWVLRRIGGETRFCRSRACRAEDGCFHKLARRSAREADLVVVNHSLLLADAISGGVLPEHRMLVIDEAHLLPDAALDQLTVRVSERSLSERVRAMGGAGEPGVSDRLRRAARLLPSRVAAQQLAARVRSLEEGTTPALAAVREFWAALRSHPDWPVSGARRRFGETQPLAEFPPPAYDALLEAVAPLGETVHALIEDLTGEKAPAEDEESTDLLEAAETMACELEEELDALARILDPRDPRFVHCLEMDPREGASLSLLPLETGPELRDRVIGRHAAVALTSATLAVGEDFSHFAAQVGLERGEPTELRLSSPFALERQLRAIVPAYAPDPRREGYAGFLARTLAEIVPEVPHKTLALFTAYDTLAQTAAALRHEMARSSAPGPAGGGAQPGAPPLAGIELLVQSRDEGRAQLIERFRSSPRALLLGTASFWYGVDFPGDELELLALTRLPFPVPSDPRVEALAERLAEQGRSSFETQALPEAILRFRQGLGRLIRRGSDRGVCVILDPRIVRAPYGGRFRAALPAPPVTVEDPQALREEVRRWFAAQEEEGRR